MGHKELDTTLRLNTNNDLLVSGQDHVATTCLLLVSLVPLWLNPALQITPATPPHPGLLSISAPADVSGGTLTPAGTCHLWAHESTGFRLMLQWPLPPSRHGAALAASGGAGQHSL